MNLFHRHGSLARWLYAQSVIVFLCVTMAHIPAPASAQTERTIEFGQFEELPNGRIAHDAGIIEPGASKSVSLKISSPLQPVMVQLVSLTFDVPLKLTIYDPADPSGKITTETDESQMALQTVSANGGLKIVWETETEASGYVLSVFVRDPLPVSQPIFTRPTAESDPLEVLAAANQPEAGMVKKLLNVLRGNEPSSRSQTAAPIAPDMPVARDEKGICSISRSDVTGDTPNDISEALQKLRETAAKNNDEHLRQLAAKGVNDLLQKLIGEIAPPLVKKVFPDGTGAVQNLISNSARNFVTDAVKLSAKTGFEAAKTYVLIQKADDKCNTPLGFKMPRLPISHSQNADFCRTCYDAAYDQIEHSINELERIHCLYGVGKEIRDQARVAMNAAGSGSVFTLPMALLEIEKMNQEFDKVVYGPAQQRHLEEMSKLERGLQSLAQCEADMVGFDGWYERFGFSFQANMASAYQIKHD